MNFSPTPLIGALVAVAAVTNISFSQSDQEPSVILYNSQPVEVELSSSGQILTFYGLLSNYMDAYIDVAPIATVQPTVVSDIDPFFTNTSKNAEYDVVSNERLTLNFDSGFATLSDESIRTLNTIPSRLRSSEYTKVIVTAYTGTDSNEKLIENRLKSALQYLMIKGVEESQVRTEILEGQALSDKLTINYIQ